MQRSLVRFACGIAVLAGTASPAWAQRGRHNGNVSTPYGTFSAAEMTQAGGDTGAALQMRQQRQAMQQEQQQLKMQQQYAKDQAKQKEFAKKHPEAARALAAPAPKSAKKKGDKKDKAATTPAGAKAKKGS